jgi:hypothetical protein
VVAGLLMLGLGVAIAPVAGISNCTTKYGNISVL